MKTRPCLAALALMTALAGCGGNGGEGGAYRACERAVESTLKAPSTADFSGATGSKIKQTGDNYDVAGYVDSENSYGAKVRSAFTCTVRSTGDNWELVDLNVT